MNLSELRDALERDGYDRRWYSFDPFSHPLEGYTLEHNARRWTMFYTERGETRDIASFESEFDACKFFYERMREGYASALKPRH